MSEEVVDEPFRLASKRVQEAFDQAAEELTSKVKKARSEALKNVSQ